MSAAESELSRWPDFATASIRTQSIRKHGRVALELGDRRHAPFQETRAVEPLGGDVLDGCQVGHLFPLGHGSLGPIWLWRLFRIRTDFGAHHAATGNREYRTRGE